MKSNEKLGNHNTILKLVRILNLITLVWFDLNYKNLKNTGRHSVKWCLAF